MGGTMKDIETIVCLDKSRIQFSEYQKFKEQEQCLAKRIYELQSDLSREKSKNEELIEELKNEKQLNAEIKKRLIEVEYDCEEFNHEYCDPNCNGKRKETIDLLQLISDGLNETLLKQKDEENKQLAKRICELQADLSRVKTDLEYAKAIVKDLLNNSHEYAKRNAEDFIKGEKK